MTAFASSLRVYEPLAAFEGEERARWEALAAAGTDPSAVARRERERVLRAVVARRLPEDADEALVTEVDGVTLVCPLRTAARSWESVVDFVDQLPDELADAFVPRAVSDAAEIALDQWRLDHPERRAHVATSTWSVPLRWFVLVDADERVVQLGEGPVQTGRQLVYRTAMSRARRRTARALAVLRRTVDDGTVTQGVEDLGRWLEEFHPRSVVELDYGGLVHLLDDAELRQDESARDVAEALQALADGAPDRAAAAYARVTARMKALDAVENAN